MIKYLIVFLVILGIACVALVKYDSWTNRIEFQLINNSNNTARFEWVCNKISLNKTLTIQPKASESFIECPSCEGQFSVFYYNKMSKIEVPLLGYVPEGAKKVNIVIQENGEVSKEIFNIDSDSNLSPYR